MFDAQQILGALLSDGESRHRNKHSSRRQSSGDGLLSAVTGSTAGKVAMGAAGVAAAGGLAYMAYRHFQGNSPQGAPGQAPSMGGPAGYGGAPGYGAPQPAATPQAGGGVGGFLGGLFGSPTEGNQGAYNPSAYGVPSYANDPSTWGQAPSAPQAPVQQSWGGAPAAAPAQAAQGWGAPAAPGPADPQGEAMLLVRAMIAAAAVDGQVDEGERSKILGGAASAGLGPAEKDALLREIAQPQTPYLLLAQLRNPELVEQFYVVSLFSVTCDSEAEKAYLRGLPYVLGMKPERVAQLHNELGIAPITA